MPVSQSFGFLPVNTPLEVTDGGNSLTVDGPLTDTQLRATAVPVSGTVTANTGLTQPLTDAQLRASSVPVSGTVGISGTVPVSGTFWQATQPVSIPVGSSATVTTFSSISSAQILASNSARKLAVIFNSTPNVLYVLLGSGTVSSTNYTIALGEQEVVSFSNITTEIKGIYAISGTAYVTSVT